MPYTYPVRFTPRQRAVTHDVLAAIANDPDWSETTGEQDWPIFTAAVEVIAESPTPRLSGGQLRVLRSVLALVGNAPDVWEDYAGGERGWAVLARATEAVIAAHVYACRAESTPAGSLQ